MYPHMGSYDQKCLVMKLMLNPLKGWNVLEWIPRHSLPHSIQDTIEGEWEFWGFSTDKVNIYNCMCHLLENNYCKDNTSLLDFCEVLGCLSADMCDSIFGSFNELNSWNYTQVRKYADSLSRQVCCHINRMKDETGEINIFRVAFRLMS